MLQKFALDIATVAKYNNSGPLVNLDIITFELNSHYQGTAPFAVQQESPKTHLILCQVCKCFKLTFESHQMFFGSQVTNFYLKEAQTSHQLLPHVLSHQASSPSQSCSAFPAAQTVNLQKVME